MKKLSVVVAGTGQIRDVEIQPGTTAGDILHQLNLHGLLAVQGSERALLCRRRVGLRQGQGRRENLRLDQSRSRSNAAVRVKDLGTRPAPASIRELFSRVVRGHGPAIRRPAPPDSLLAGTRLDSPGQHLHRQLPNAHTRHFRDRSRSTAADTSISGCTCPSNEIRRHSHWVCFQHRGNDWYVVHMAKRMPKDVSSGIMTIERLITEAYEQ